MKKIFIGAGTTIVIIVVIVAYGFSVDEKIQNNSSEPTPTEVIEPTVIENPEAEGTRYTLSLSEVISSNDSP